MIRWLALCVCVIPSVGGCGSTGPPGVRFGEEACAQCRMIINDDRFAAARTLESGEVLKFDDLGCLIDHIADNRGEAATHDWVLDYQSGQWLDAVAAHFIYGPQLQTPMASGVAAVATLEEADTLAREWGGRTFRWTELPGFFRSRRGGSLESDAEPNSIPSNTSEGRR